MQEKARAVVMITKLKEKNKVKCEPYIPAYSARYDDVQVTVKQVIEKNGYTIRQIHLKVSPPYLSNLLSLQCCHVLNIQLQVYYNGNP